MASHGTTASFDPLSADNDEAFTTVFDSASEPAQPPAATAPTAAPTAAAASEYDSFMTAQSAMSYMSQSAGGGAGAVPTAPPAPAPAKPPTASDPFRRLPDTHAAPAAPGPTPPAPFDDLFSDPPRPSQTEAQPHTATSSSAHAAAPAVSHGGGGGGGGGGADLLDLGPLSFGDDAAGARGGGSGGRGGGGASAHAAFAVPMDLYDTPDYFASNHASSTAAPRGVPAAAVAAPPPPSLPPLHDFTRELSTALPISEDPMSPTPGSFSATPLAGYASGGGAAASGGGSGTSGGGGGGAHAHHAHAPSGGGGGGAYKLFANPFAPPRASTSGAGAALPSGGGGGGGSGGAGQDSAADGDAGSSTPGGGGGGGYSAAALLTNTVSVHSPRKAVAPSRIPGLSDPYTVFSVTSRGAGAAEATVDRRFRDVVALAEVLQALHPGCFVPPRPSRSALEARRASPAFLEERRQGIERFLCRLVVHPVLGPSEATQVWLRLPSPDLRSAPEWQRLAPGGGPGLARSTARLLMQVVGREPTVPSPAEAVRPAAEAGDVYRLVHEKSAQLRGVLARAQPSASEERLREEAAALAERSNGLVALGRAADHWVARGTSAGRCVGKLAEAMEALAGADEAAAEAEAAEGSGAAAATATAAAALRAAAEGCAKASKLYGIATDATARHLSPLHDWLAAVPGATSALAARERCLLTSATLAQDEAAARQRLAEAEARGVPTPAAARKLEALRQQVAGLAAAAGAAREEYERVGRRNAEELAAFKAAMSRELADAVREVALVQAAAAQKATELWRAAAAQLSQLAAPPGSMASGAGPSGSGGGAPGAAQGQELYGGF
ncbi:hypothetical protein HYH03_014285 [Edaphochlamys debaryana]|uniref:PX domain-containing protein n=1 Tax=Edaphochlamys debaryana TaxID=47281 RepID=A0A835XWF1_9CHLO|nr:hypothetical protein HYH03_014285 [Edaphochlamys debaryana]|eukprot:KAG2487039.1 hypothetical protein HYH03_014285 [Edaphochlamys debaryana]